MKSLDEVIDEATRIIVILVYFIFLIICLPYIMMTLVPMFIPKSSLFVEYRVRADNIAWDVNRYFEKEHNLPSSLDLVKNEENNKCVPDIWGRDYIYEIIDEGTIRLGTYGKDGKAEGTGENKDYFWRYDIKNFKFSNGIFEDNTEKMPKDK